MGWKLTSEEKPSEGSNVEYSNDGITVEGTMDYKENRVCAGYSESGRIGSFSQLGFATDDTCRAGRNLICDNPKFWRYWE